MMASNPATYSGSNSKMAPRNRQIPLEVFNQGAHSKIGNPNNQMSQPNQTRISQIQSNQPQYNLPPGFIEENQAKQTADGQQIQQAPQVKPIVYMKPSVRHIPELDKTAKAHGPSLRFLPADFEVLPPEVQGSQNLKMPHNTPGSLRNIAFTKQLDRGVLSKIAQDYNNDDPDFETGVQEYAKVEARANLDSIGYRQVVCDSSRQNFRGQADQRKGLRSNRGREDSGSSTVLPESPVQQEPKPVQIQKRTAASLRIATSPAGRASCQRSYSPTSRGSAI